MKRADPMAGPAESEIVSLGDEERGREIVTGAARKLWEVFNRLTRWRPSRRDRFRVTVFGSARVPKEHWVYGAVRDLAAELTRMVCDVITGGGPGLMEAANEGAHAADPEALR